MTSITEIQELARTLNLQNIAKGIIDLSHDKESNLAYLKEILQKEVDKREEFAVLRREKAGRLPKKEFVTTNINSGIAWQIERLEELEWIEKDQNLILIGKCGCGKTSLAAHLGRKALESGIKVSYNTFDDFLYTINNKDASEKQMRRFRYFTASSLIIIDDMMYTGVRNEDLVKFYHSIMLLNETRSIIFITNRELSSWLEATEDRHLMQTLIDRITVNSQIIRLN
jgi:DNA replication protein DnaC